MKILSLFFCIPLIVGGCMVNSDKERDKRLLAYYQNRRGTPAEYCAKMVKDFSMVRYRVSLTGGMPSYAKSLARKELCKLEAEIQKGMAWKQALSTAGIPFQLTPPTIDGIIAPEEWKHALVYRGEYDLGSTQQQNTSSNFYIMYDKNYIYFAAQIEDHDIQLDNTTPPYWNDSVELFLRPDNRLDNYLELVVPPEGEHYSAWCVQPPDRRFDISVRKMKGITTAARATPNGYEVEGKIAFFELPGYLLGNPPHPGDPMNFMFVHCNRTFSGKYTRSTPIPFLYDGHNIYGYIRGTLGASTK